MLSMNFQIFENYRERHANTLLDDALSQSDFGRRQRTCVALDVEIDIQVSGLFGGFDL